MSFESDELSYDCVLPSAILFNPNLELTTVKLYAVIRGLTKKHGYCYATNRYLSSVMDCSERSVTEWIVQLKKEGYLEVETDKNGINWQRRIYISDKFKKLLRKEAQFHPPRSTVPPPSQPASTILEDKLNEDKLRGEEPPPQKDFTYHRIKMQWKELDDLVKDFGHKKTDEMLDRLNEYAKTHPKKFKEYGCHATVIRVWIRRDKGDPQKTTSKFQENLDYANKIMQLFPEQVQKEEIILKETSLVFTYGTVYKEFEFKDFDFKTKVINRLKSMGLHV